MSALRSYLEEGGVREGGGGVRKPQNHTEIRQNSQTASDIFQNAETIRTTRPQYESCRKQDLLADVMNPDML